MSKTIVILAIATLAALLGVAFSQPAARAIQLKQAFDDGLISLTFAAKDSGARLEVTATRVSSEPLLVKIEKGGTRLDFGRESVTITTDRAIEVDLSRKEEGSFTVLQSGENVRITAGAITWTKLPKKDPNQR